MTKFVAALTIWYAIKTFVRFVCLVLDQEPTGYSGEKLSDPRRYTFGIKVVAGISIIIWGLFLLFL